MGSEQGLPLPAAPWPWCSEVDDDAGGGGMNCLASGDMMALNALSGRVTVKAFHQSGFSPKMQLICPDILLTNYSVQRKG